MRDNASSAVTQGSCTNIIYTEGLATGDSLSIMAVGAICVLIITICQSMEFISIRNWMTHSKDTVRRDGRKYMETERTSSESLGEITCEIDIKFLSFNGYVDMCRRNRYQSAKYKKDIENEIGFYIRSLPRFDNPVRIHFHWIEQNKRRDLDNVCFAKKFILDALVKFGKITDDNAKWVRGFTDTFGYGSETKVILTIQEVEK